VAPSERLDRAESDRATLLRSTLAAVAPGTALRAGLESIIRGRTGALIVLGFDKDVDALCTGGFLLDVEFSPTHLRELAKMDGAVILDRDATRILRANVHLMPDPSIPTTEAGTRHRTAERVAIQSAHPVISVSQSMHVVALYVDGQRYVLEDTAEILSRANQALATLERYRSRLDEVAGTLSALEVEDLVTVRDVCAVAQRIEMVRRISAEIEDYLVELGTEGRLLRLQHDELVAGLEADRELVARDYVPAGSRKSHASERAVEKALTALDELDSTQLLDPIAVGAAIGFPTTVESLDTTVNPRGYRLLARVPRLPGPVVEGIVNHFGGLQSLLMANEEDLQAVEGVGDARARTIREGLTRIGESTIVERFV
jgi:diadenylate cyclase